MLTCNLNILIPLFVHAALRRLLPMPRMLRHYQRAIQRYCSIQSRVGITNWSNPSRANPPLPAPVITHRYRYLTSSRTMAPELDSYFKQYVDFNPQLGIQLDIEASGPLDLPARSFVLFSRKSWLHCVADTQVHLE